MKMVCFCEKAHFRFLYTPCPCFQMIWHDFCFIY